MVRNHTKTSGIRENALKVRVGRKHTITGPPIGNTIFVMACVVFILSLSILLWDYTRGRIEQGAFEELSILKETDNDVITSTVPGASATDEHIKPTAPVPNPQSKVLLPKYEALYAKNPDMIGWVQIEGTKVDYPVMYTQDDFYLTHNFEKKQSARGIPYVDKRFSVDPFYTNTIIHGHNMKDDSMFSSLLGYESEKYYQEHPLIRFDSIYQERNYAIIAAFPSEIFPQNDQESFKPYQFLDAKNEVEFDDFIKNVKELSLYPIEETAEYGDRLLTLMTCAYHTKNGRFIIVAREIKNGRV